MMLRAELIDRCDSTVLPLLPLDFSGHHDEKLMYKFHIVATFLQSD